MNIRLIGPAGIPSLGLATFRMDAGETREIVAAALAVGYRHIDTAQAYGNEAEVGEALRAAATPRDRIFVTTKIMPKDFSAADFRTAAERSLTALGTDYIDLMLLHWPSREVPLAETLQVLDALIADGKIRYGGVSNFTIAQTDEAREILQAPLAANQIEMHPFIDQRRLLGHLAAHDVPAEAYAPLAKGKVMEDATLRKIAETHGCSAAAIALAWLLHKPMTLAIPKTGKAHRLAENLAAGDITLTSEEISQIDALARPEGRLVSPDGLAPVWD